MDRIFLRKNILYRESMITQTIVLFALIYTLLHSYECDSFRTMGSKHIVLRSHTATSHPQQHLTQYKQQHRTRGHMSMNMFDRFRRVITSNVNNVIKGLEDPEKVIEQAVLDMQNDLVKIRQSYSEISASLKRMEKQKTTALANAEEWYRRAQLAVEKGDEELAREALKRRQAQQEIGDNLTQQISLQTSTVDKLYQSMMALEAKISEAKREKDAMIARARTAKTSVQVTDMLNSIGDTSTAMDAFERMREKVEALETKAEVAGELAMSNAGTSTSMEQRFRDLENDTKLEDELSLLKKQLPSGAAAKVEKPKELPQAATALDFEYERLKRELGR